MLEVVNAFGGAATITSTVLVINEDATGAAALSLLGGVIQAGATVSADVGGLSDRNGGGVSSYSWFVGNTRLPASGGSYVLRPSDLQAAAAGQLRAEVV